MSGEREQSAIVGVIDRPRLYRILDSPLVRVCIVQGPSGSGKTTLLRSWALQSDPARPTVWVSLNAGVSSRQAFWQQVARSASRMGRLPDDTVEWLEKQYNLSRDPVDVASRVLAAAGPLVIALDAYEHLGDQMPTIDADLARLLTLAPGLRLIVTTRSPTALADSDPPDGIVRVITHRELALTPEEVQALISSQAGIHDRHLATTVAATTRGFALTVRAIALMLSQLGRIPNADSAEWGEVIATRLEALLPDATAVRFVTDTSVPPYVDAELGQLLSGSPETTELFDMLESNGFGRWIPYTHNRQVFQYVEAIRDTFLARAKQDSVRFRRSCVTTAAWLLENEEAVEHALKYAIDGGDFGLADRVFVSLVIRNPDAYVTDRFLSTLRTVPEAELTRYPMLAFGLALALAANPVLRTGTARVARIAAESAARPSYIEPSLDEFTTAGMQAIARRLFGDTRGTSDGSLAAVRFLNSIDPAVLAPHGDHVGTVLRQLSYSLFVGGRINDAMAAIDQSIGWCQTPQISNFSAVYVMGYAAFEGNSTRVARLSRTLVDSLSWPDELKRTSLHALAVLAEGYTRLDALDFAGALEALNATERYRETSEHWPLFAGISVTARQMLGQGLAEVKRVTSEISSPIPRLGVGENMPTERLHAVLALAQLAGGETAAAERTLRSQPVDGPHSAFARIAVDLATGNERETLRKARSFVALPGHTKRTLAETQTFGAVAALRLGERDVAWSWLSDAALTWETYGPRMHVALLAPRDRRLLLEFGRERESSSILRFLDVPTPEIRVGHAGAGSLTARERVVLAALATHDSNRAIAEALVVSPHTVKAQLQSVYRKLGVSSRQAALAVAREQGLIPA